MVEYKVQKYAVVLYKQIEPFLCGKNKFSHLDGKVSDGGTKFYNRTTSMHALPNTCASNKMFPTEKVQSTSSK
jgi:hypothetical protein